MNDSDNSTDHHSDPNNEVIFDSCLLKNHRHAHLSLFWSHSAEIIKTEPLQIMYHLLTFRVGVPLVTACGQTFDVGVLDLVSGTLRLYRDYNSWNEKNVTHEFSVCLSLEDE